MGTNTGIGIGIGIPFKNNALGGDRPYLPPELKARLIGVWDNYGKKNTDADRNIIKNKIPNAGGDLEILNAAYKLNSGFGEYKEDFTSWRIYPNIEVTDNVITTNGNFNSTWFIYKHANENEINEMNIKVSGIPEGGIIRYFYIPDETATIPVSYNISEDGVYHLPKSKLSSNKVSVGFTVSSSYDWNNIRIEQLSDFGGAFVTDGVNDMIISQKTLQEMGVTKDFTIVSMIHQISWRGSSSIPLTNYIRPTDNIYVRNQVADIGKTGIYGYVVYDIKNSTVGNSHIVNTILGDKNDYSIYTIGDLSQGKFSVQGYIDGNSNIRETSSVAHYWTFALLGKATEDDINLIIAYFNLDRTLKPDILCNTIKQGITNENHAEFGDKLIDFSGNGRDIQLNNIAWNKESGIDDDGALRLDGVNDFGKVTGMPIYKDYTVVADREIIDGLVENADGGVALKGSRYLTGAFCFDYKDAAFSFGTPKMIPLDTKRFISYQSKYVSNGISINIGTATDNDELWIGRLGNDERYSKIAIRFLMSFPYSMSEFLIERQLKKHKLGTLYPDMVEFRPIVKSNNKWDIIEIWQGDKSLYRPAINDDKTGIYLKKDSTIGIYVKPYVGQKVSEIVYNGVSYTNLKLNSNGFYYIIVPVTKSPQKIGITIEQDENYVLFNPVINSNYDNYKLTFHLREYEKLINIGDYIPKGTYIRANLYLKNNIDELVTFTFNGVNINYRRSPYDDTAFNIRQIYNYDSPQEVNITIDEYIRYEDIDFTNCYPGVPRIYVNDKSVTWGDKLKVGDEFTFYGNVNILPKMYNVLVKALYNGEEMVYGSIGTISKSMVFTSFKTYLLDNNEPKCILSPRLLRIPNSSYKILGYIPDISGHGNHGVIHNSAYAEMSGANGYGTNLGNWSINSANTGKIITQREEHLEYEVLSADKNILFYNTKIENDTFVIYTSVNTNIVYSKESDIIANIPANTPTKVVCPKIGTILLKTNETPTVGNIIIVKQYGIYEGAYCFDGVDDFVTIPTVTGGKQVLMKVNWDSSNSALLYDQRGYNNEFAIYNGSVDSDGNPIPAYSGRNNGQTYIDGILNSNIKASELRAITHNITITNELSLGTNNTYPVIGSTRSNTHFAQMSLYDFMLFDNISTDDKIKELNEYVGIEAKVELPPYYWDAYGKTNLDADKATIQQRGIAVGDYDLTNYNHAYEGMSGYNAYPVVFGIGKTYGGMPSTDDFTYTVSPTTVNVTKFNITHGFIYSYLKHNGELETQNSDYPSYKIKVTGLEKGFGLHYSYLKNPSDANLSAFAIGTDGTYTIPKSFASDGSLINNNVWIGFIFTGTAPESCNVTIEVLPEYENGLAYDGVTDYSKNANIPAFTNYTYIFKRTIINIPTNAATLLKGADKTNGGAFIADYGNKWQFNFGQYNTIQGIADGINWQTVNSFNGTSINKGRILMIVELQ